MFEMIGMIGIDEKKNWLAYRWDMKYTDNISRLLAPDSLSVISPYDWTALYIALARGRKQLSSRLLAQLGVEDLLHLVH